MTGPEQVTLSLLLTEQRAFRVEVKAGVAALSKRVRSLEDSRLTEATLATAAAETATTAATTAAAAAKTAAAAAAAAAGIRADRRLSIRAWLTLGFTAIATSVVAYVQLATYFGWRATP